MAFFEPLFAALNEAQVRYVVVGGVATVLHGHARLTADVDLVIDLEPAACGRAIDVLAQLGLQPRLPVDAADFAAPAIRRRWVEEKGMRVFSWVDPDNPLRAVDPGPHRAQTAGRAPQGPRRHREARGDPAPEGGRR